MYDTVVLTIFFKICFFCTVEPQYNKPLYNEVLGITNNYFSLPGVIVKYMEKTCDIMKPRYSEQICQNKLAMEL